MVWAILNDTIMAGVNEFIDHPSERIVAILGGAVAEEALRRAIETRLRQSTLIERIFEDGGVLGGFRSKIEIGYLLYMYEKPARLALVGISEIRNFFAHNMGIKEFAGAASELDKGFEKLRLHTLFKKYPNPFWAGDSDFDVEDPTDRRSVFVVNLKLILALLMSDMNAHQIYSNVPKDLPLPPHREPPLPEHEP